MARHAVRLGLVAAATAVVAGLLCLPVLANDRAVRQRQTSQTRTGTGQHYAILIGCDGYRFVSPLKYCVADAHLVRDTLVGQCGYSPERVVLLVDDARSERQKPTRGNIINQLSAWLQLPTENDTVVVFYSGHGAEVAGKSYLVPIDGGLDNLALTGVPVQFVRDQMRACKARRKVLILDACHSGSEKGLGQMTAGFLGAIQSGEGLVTLASCRVDEVSHEAPEFGHGAFTHFLVQGLGGAADREGQGNNDGVVTAGELNYYVWEKVRLWAARSGKKQTPMYVAAVQGTIALAYVGPQAAQRPARLGTAGLRRSSPQRLVLELGGGVTMELVLIPAGQFMMGSPPSEAKRNSDEGPQHRVRISKPFYLGKYEVTQAQWQAVMGNNPSYFKGDDLPVENVSWNDCQEFCRRLSAKMGRDVRLPTEAEWEYACRAGTTTPFAFGSSLSSDQANFNGNFPYGGASKGPDRDRTTPVGSFQPNAWGLYDMHGNVWEWCQDWYGPYSAGEQVDPTGPSSGSGRVLRGGCWDINAYFCRSAVRIWGRPDYRSGNRGFRCAARSLASLWTGMPAITVAGSASRGSEPDSGAPAWCHVGGKCRRGPGWPVQQLPRPRRLETMCRFLGGPDPDSFDPGQNGTVVRNAGTDAEQPEQQHRMSLGPALSFDPQPRAQNCPVQGWPVRGCKMAIPWTIGILWDRGQAGRWLMTIYCGNLRIRPAQTARHAGSILRKLNNGIILQEIRP